MLVQWVQCIFVEMLRIKSQTHLFINTDQETSPVPMSSVREMAVAELTDVCAVVEVATENEEPAFSSTEVCLPLQDSHVSCYSGRVLYLHSALLSLCCIHHMNDKLHITVTISVLCYCWHQTQLDIIFMNFILYFASTESDTESTYSEEDLVQVWM